MADLANKVALVTGGSRGIGRAVAWRLAVAGAAVAVVSLGDAPQRVATAQALKEAGTRCLEFDADVADYEQARAIVRAVAETWGRVDILVNNAGMPQPKGILELTEADWDRTMAVNLKSAFNWSQAVLPFMLAARWGRIVNMSSMSAKFGGGPPLAVSRIAYATAKAGVLGFTRALAREAAPYITVNAVCPGPIVTEMTQSLMTGEAGEHYANEVPLRRLGKPSDVAAAVLFLASEDAGFITGEVMDVNGGVYID